MDKGPWITTFSGRCFHIFQPMPDEIDIEDIAHSLSNQCRFNGHCNAFYSVAEHCVHIAKAAGDNTALALAGLLHDATEAYISDVPKPVKRCLPDFTEMEEFLMKFIFERFGADLSLLGEVKKFDNQILVTEAPMMNIDAQRDWGMTEDPLPCKIECWVPSVAKEKFLTLFHQLASPS